MLDLGSIEDLGFGGLEFWILGHFFERSLAFLGGFDHKGLDFILRSLGLKPEAEIAVVGTKIQEVCDGFIGNEIRVFLLNEDF